MHTGCNTDAIARGQVAAVAAWVPYNGSEPPLPLTFLCSKMKVDDNCPLPPHFCLIKIKPQQPQLGVNSNLRDSIWGFLCKKNSFLLHAILWQIHNIHKMEVTVCSPPPKGSQILMSKKSKIESPSPSFSLFYACPK